MGEVHKLPAQQEIQKTVARLNAENAQLKNVLQQSNQRLKQAADRIQFLETNDFYRHLEWIWKILHDEGHDWDEGFLTMLHEEFVSMMTPPKPAEQQVLEGQDNEESKEESNGGGD